MTKEIRDVKNYLRKEHSRDKDWNNFFEIENISENSVEYVKSKVEVNSNIDYVNGWKAECSCQDLDMNYNINTIIYVLEDNNGNLYSFSKNNSSNSTTMSNIEY